MNNYILVVINHELRFRQHSIDLQWKHKQCLFTNKSIHWCNNHTWIIMNTQNVYTTKNRKEKLFFNIFFSLSIGYWRTYVQKIIIIMEKFFDLVCVYICVFQYQIHISLVKSLVKNHQPIRELDKNQFNMGA